MTIETVIALVIQSGLIVAGFFTLHIKLIDRINAVKEHSTELINAIDRRMVKMESLLDVFGTSAAKILHRDDDRYGADKLLEKYLANHNNLSMEEWFQLHAKMEEIVKNEMAPKSERTLAGWLSALAIHKMGVYWTERQHTPTV